MVSAEVSPFIDDMPGAFARADLLLCRSGASTVAEVTAAGKPAIFIPLPTAADDHQRHNAATLAAAGAARLLPQSELSPRATGEEVVSLLGDRAAYWRNVAGGARLCPSRRGCYDCLSCCARGWRPERSTRSA